MEPALSRLSFKSRKSDRCRLNWTSTALVPLSWKDRSMTSWRIDTTFSRSLPIWTLLSAGLFLNIGAGGCWIMFVSILEHLPSRSNLSSTSLVNLSMSGNERCFIQNHYSSWVKKYYLYLKKII